MTDRLLNLLEAIGDVVIRIGGFFIEALKLFIEVAEPVCQ